MSQQLVKKSTNGKHENVMPRSWIEAIKDKNTGQTLVEILQGFNMYFLPYNGNTSSTRCLVPTILRKKGLWITYVKYDGNVYTEWYAADEIDDKSWGDSSNWRIGNNTLVGDITISANGNWVINGTETEFKAVGEKGNTPLIRVANNRLQVSYDLGDTYIDVTNNPVYTKFRWLATSGDTQANNVGRIQASTDEGKTWTNMSNDFTNNLHIKKYTGVNESLPTSGIAEGTIYAKGPYYAEDDTLNDNPIYRLWVYAWKGNTLAWQDNGEFTGIAAGVVQETGDSETEVMSQKAVTEKLSELGSKAMRIFTICGADEEYVEGNVIVGLEPCAYRMFVKNWDVSDISSGLNVLVVTAYNKEGGELGITSFTKDEIPSEFYFTVDKDAYSLKISGRVKMGTEGIVLIEKAQSANMQMKVHGKGDAFSKGTILYDVIPNCTYKAIVKEWDCSEVVSNSLSVLVITVHDKSNTQLDTYAYTKDEIPSSFEFTTSGSASYITISGRVNSGKDGIVFVSNYSSVNNFNYLEAKTNTIHIIGKGDTYVEGNIITSLFEQHIYVLTVKGWNTSEVSKGQYVFNIDAIDERGNQHNIISSTKFPEGKIKFIMPTGCNKIRVSGRINNGVSPNIAITDVTELYAIRHEQLLCLIGLGDDYARGNSIAVIGGQRYSCMIEEWHDSELTINSYKLNIIGIKNDDTAIVLKQFTVKDNLPKYFIFNIPFDVSSIKIDGRANASTFNTAIIKECSYDGSIDVETIQNGHVISDLSYTSAFHPSFRIKEGGEYECLIGQNNTLDELVEETTFISKGNVCTLNTNKITPILYPGLLTTEGEIVWVYNQYIIPYTDDRCVIRCAIKFVGESEAVICTYDVNRNYMSRNKLIYQGKSVDYTITNYKKMLYELGYINNAPTKPETFTIDVNSICIYQDELYVVAGHLRSDDSINDTRNSILKSTDGINWELLWVDSEARLPLGNEASLCIIDNKAYVVERGDISIFSYVVDLYNKNILHTEVITNSILSRPKAFIYEGEPYFAVNVVPTIFNYANNNIGYLSRLQVAFIKIDMNNHKHTVVKQIASPDSIQYYDVQIFGGDDEDWKGRQSVYFVWSEDKRKISKERQFSNVSISNITHLFH